MADNDNFQDFENNYELRKALNKLENELQKKEYENTSLKTLYQDMKNLNERTSKECNSLTNKLNTVRNEMNIMEKKYISEIENLKSNNSKKIEIYENKILKLSEYNPNNLRKNIEIEIENKYKQEMSLKDKEIDQITNELNELKQRNELLEIEYETYKNDIEGEITTLKKLHQNEINNLIEKIRISENFPEKNSENSENLNQIKNELDSTRRQVSELNNEIDKLRHEKELLTIEKNDYKLNSLKNADIQKFTTKKLETELNKAQNFIGNMQREIDTLNNNIKDKDFQINDLTKEREGLKERIFSLESEFQEMQNMVQSLKNIIKSNEEEKDNEFLERDRNNKEMIIKERKEKENYQKQIDELNIKLKEARTNDMTKKENEIKKLKEEIKMYKKEMLYDNNSQAYKDLLEKLKVVTEKKNEYKLQCKIANENMELIIKKLNQEQKKEFIEIIQNTKKKYLQNDKL